MYMENSKEVNKDYVMVMYNPVEESYTYQVYHVLDICKINNKSIVNVQTRGKNNKLKRITLSESKFYDLLYRKILTRL